MRLLRSHRRRALFDRAVAAYANWHLECFAVQNAYRMWRGASRPNERLAFEAYRAALDREERAAIVYARLMRQAGQLIEPDLAVQLVQSQSGSTV